MGRPSANDLRCRILQAYEQGEGSQPQLAQRFRVSVSYIEKIHCQLRRTGKMERIPHVPGASPSSPRPFASDYVAGCSSGRI